MTSHHRDATSRIDAIDAVRPGGIGSVDGVVDAVNQAWNVDFQEMASLFGNVHALFICSGIFDSYSLPGVLPRLPAVTGVRFFYIDDEKGGGFFVAVEELLQIANLATKWRSGIASENEHNGLPASEAGQNNFMLTISGLESKIWCAIADCERVRHFHVSWSAITLPLRKAGLADLYE